MSFDRLSTRTSQRALETRSRNGTRCCTCHGAPGQNQRCKRATLFLSLLPGAFRSGPFPYRLGIDPHTIYKPKCRQNAAFNAIVLERKHQDAKNVALTRIVKNPSAGQFELGLLRRMVLHQARGLQEHEGMAQYGDESALLGRQVDVTGALGPQLHQRNARGEIFASAGRLYAR